MRNRENNPLAKDLDHILVHTEGIWEDLKGKSLFITGGTGFFGCWLLQSFAWANDRLDLKARAVVLTRNPGSFKIRMPHLAGSPAIRFLEGDVRSFDFPRGEFTHVVHAAADTRASLYEQVPLEMFDTIVQGTRRTLEFANSSGAGKFLLTSSGAVYGKQPPQTAHVREDYPGAPNPGNSDSVYGEGKRGRRTALRAPMPHNSESRQKLPAALPSSDRTCRWTPTLPSATSLETDSRAAQSALMETARPTDLTCMQRTWPSGCGRSWSEGNLHAPITWDPSRRFPLGAWPNRSRQSLGLGFRSG